VFPAGAGYPSAFTVCIQTAHSSLPCPRQRDGLTAVSFDGPLEITRFWRGPVRIATTRPELPRFRSSYPRHGSKPKTDCFRIGHKPTLTMSMVSWFVRDS
jgi:hypothetical protein